MGTLTRSRLNKVWLTWVITVQNTKISLKFSLWKYFVKTQFHQSFGRTPRKLRFQKISTPENEVKIRYFMQRTTKSYHKISLKTIFFEVIGAYKKAISTRKRVLALYILKPFWSKFLFIVGWNTMKTEIIFISSAIYTISGGTRGHFYKNTDFRKICLY